MLRATALSDRDARGGFSLSLCPCLCLQVPDSSRADPNAPLPELDGFLRLRTLVPRSPPGSTVRPKQQAGAGGHVADSSVFTHAVDQVDREL